MPTGGGIQEGSGQTGRRGFFRRLVLSAIETAEKAGREMADRGLRGFREPPPYRTHRSSNPYSDPRYTVYGPPWPPPYGPYVDAQLHAQLRATWDAQLKPEGFTVAHDSQE